MDPQSGLPPKSLHMFHGLIKHRQIILQMAKRDVIGRYKGSMLGLAWSFLNPLIMLLVYTFVFSVIFKTRWHAGADSKTEFALALFIGLIAHGLLAESINRAPNLILKNATYVKKVVFPLEILPWISMGATLFHTLVSLSVWSLFFVLMNHSFNWTALFLPLVFLPLVFFGMGFSWFLASLGVFLRDVGQITGVLTMALLFLSGVFYPMSRLPENYQAVLSLNPLAFIIEQSRAVLMWGQLPNWKGLGITMIISVFVAFLGFNWFQKTRRGFADVL